MSVLKICKMTRHRHDRYKLRYTSTTPWQVNFRAVELVTQDTSHPNMSNGSRWAERSVGSGRRVSSGWNGWGYGRNNAMVNDMFRDHLVFAAKGFIRAIMLGKKKWSALVQQVTSP